MEEHTERKHYAKRSIQLKTLPETETRAPSSSPPKPRTKVITNADHARGSSVQPENISLPTSAQPPLACISPIRAAAINQQLRAASSRSEMEFPTQTPDLSQWNVSPSSSTMRPKSSQTSPAPRTLPRPAPKIAKKMPSLSKPQSLVAFLVGPDESQQTFVVHKDFATFHSTVFDKIFNGPYNEGQTQKMVLDDVSSEDFGTIVHWLYTKQIESTPDAPNHILTLAKLWTLANRFTILELLRYIMEELIKLVQAEHGRGASLKSLIDYAYETKADTMLKKLIIDKLSCEVAPEILKTMKEDGQLPVEVWADIALALASHMDSVPVKYMRVWGKVEDYMVQPGEDNLGVASV